MTVGSAVAIFGASFAVSLSTAISAWPKPGIVSRESRRHGFFAAVAIVAGQLIPEAFLLVALVLLFDQFATSKELEDALFISGGLVLIWTGVWTAALSLGRGSPFSRAYAPSEGDPSRFRALTPRTALSLGIGGFALTVSSVEWFAIWFTARAALIARAVDHGIADVIGFAAGHWLADVGWLLLVATSMAVGQRFIDSQSFRIAIALSGLALVLAGAGFMHVGLQEVV